MDDFKRREIEARLEAITGGERLWSRFTENALEPITITDLEGTRLYVSPSYKTLLGYEPEELLGRPVLSLLHPDDLWQVLEDLQRDREEAPPGFFVTRNLHATGRYVWLESSGFPLLDGKGKVVGAIAFSRDITERVQVEEALRESEEKFRSIVEQASDGIALVDEEGRVTEWNRRSEEITGLRREEVVGEPIWEVQMRVFPRETRTPEMRDMFQGMMREDMEAGDPPWLGTPGEYNIERPDGSLRRVEITYSPIRGERGTLTSCVLRDITGKRLAEEALERERGTTSSLFEAMPATICLQTPGYTIPFANRQFRDAFGDPEGRACYEILHGRSGPCEECTPFQVLETGEPVIREVTNPRGEHFMVHYYPFKDEHGDMLVLEMGIDVTEGKRAEEALRKSETRLRRITDNMQDMVSVLDSAGVFRYASPSVREVLGYAPEELTGQLGFDLIHSDDRDEVMAAFADAMLKREPVRMEYRFRHALGHYVWVETLGSPLYDEEGEIIGGTVSSRDVTGRRMVQERLERINRLLLDLGADTMENITRILQTGSSMLQADTVTYSRYQKGALSIVSGTPGADWFQAGGRPECSVCWEVISANRREPLLIEDLGTTPYLELQPGLKESGMRSWMGYPVEVQGEVRGCLNVLSREAKALSREEIDLAGSLAKVISMEEERLAREEVLKDFIDIAAHELRHPVTVMKGYALTLSGMKDRLDEATREEILHAIDRGADRLTSLISQLLETSRIERGRFVVRRHEVELWPLVEQAVSEMRERGLENEYIVRADPETDRIWADPERLAQLMVILLENASHYSELWSTIELEAARGPEGVTVSVLDRGLGVCEWDRERIFERFFQVEEVMYHSTPGIGLGLYIARHIAEAHGGRIWCEARAGGGSIFRFTLPAPLSSGQVPGQDLRHLLK